MKLHSQTLQVESGPTATSGIGNGCHINETASPTLLLGRTRLVTVHLLFSHLDLATFTLRLSRWLIGKTEPGARCQLVFHGFSLYPAQFGLSLLHFGAMMNISLRNGTHFTAHDTTFGVRGFISAFLPVAWDFTLHHRGEPGRWSLKSEGTHQYW